MRVIGEPLTALERAAFLRCVRSFINVPFGHQGRKPWKLDCAGLLQVSMRGLARAMPFTEDATGAFVRGWEGRQTVDLDAYGRTPFKDGLQRILEENLGAAITDAPRAADVVLMRFSGDPQHVGVLADHPQGGLRLIHTDAVMKRVTEHAFTGEWPGHASGYYRP